MKTWNHLQRKQKQKTASYIRTMQEKLVYLKKTHETLKKTNDLLESLVIELEHKAGSGLHGSKK